MAEKIQMPAIPDVEIVDQNGKSLDTSAIDNYDAFMTFLMTASIASNTAKMRRYQEDRISKGGTQNWQLNITPEVQEIICVHPGQSLYVVNDGPGQIFVKENSWTRDATILNVNEELTTDFETHKLKRFYVWSAPGTIATARAKVKF